MTVDRANVVKAQFFEQRAGQEHAFHMFFPAAHVAAQSRRLVQYALATLAHPGIERSRQDARQVVMHGTAITRDRHLVVVQNDQQVAVGITGIVECLVSHAGRHGAIANNGNGLASLAFHSGHHRHAQCGTDRSARMTGAKTVVFTFRATEKTT